MSAGGYDAPYSYSPFSGDSWHAADLIYNRSHHHPSHRRSRSPPTRRYMTYDRYIPSRSPVRSGPAWSDSYRPDSPSPISGRYRADTPNPYLARSPSPWNASRLTPNPYLARSSSPERYFTSRVPDPDPWDSSSWLETSKPQERQPPSPTSSVSRTRGRGGSILAKRMFEPSDSWKQSHSDRHEDTARVHSGERSPGIRGDNYRPGPPHNGRSTVGRNGYDSYIPDYPPSSPENHRKSSPRSRVRTVSVSPHEARRSSPYRRRLRSRSGSLSHGRPSLSSLHHPYSRGRRSMSRGAPRSPSRGRTSTSRRQRSHSRSRSYSRSSSHGRRSRSRSASRGRSISRVLRNGSSVVKHPSRKTSHKRYSSRSSIASSIASSRASDRAPPPTVQNIQPPVTAEAIALDDARGGTQGNANVKLVQSPIYFPEAINGLLDPDAKQTRSPQVLSACATSDQPERKLEPEPIVVTDAVTDAPVLSLPLSSPRSPPAPQHTSTPLVNGIVKHEPTLKAAKIPNTAPTSSSASLSDTTLPETPPLSLRAVDRRNDDTTEADHRRSAFPSQGAKQTTRSSNIFATSLSTPQPTPDPAKVAPQIGRETTPPEPEDIPKLSEAKSTAEALRTVVMTRLLYDRQTREERVKPVLINNLQLAALSRDSRPSITAQGVIEEVIEGSRGEDRMEQFKSLRGSLVEHFKHRQVVMSEKIQRLRKEYVSLHERWVAHCASLDEQARPAAAESETVQPATRATRRSTTMSDAVRSDLEMEQIIASLGYDEATDPNQLSLRNLATVPDMISVTNGKLDYAFDDTNHLVENPSEYYGPTTGIHDWTDMEKEIFRDKFAAYPKQFGVIAEHIPNKTAAQCVDFYYLHKKKVIDFRKVIAQYAPGKRKRKGAGRKKGNGLLADIRQHDAEVHGKPEPPPPSARTARRRMARPAPKEPKEPKKPTAPRRTIILQSEETSTATPTPEPEARPKRHRYPGRAGNPSAAATTNATTRTTTPTPVMAPAPVVNPATSTHPTNIPPTPASASTSVLAASLSRITPISAEDAEEEPLDTERPAKRSRRSRKVKSAAIVNEEPSDLVQETRPVDQGESNARRKVTLVPAQWSEGDKRLFLGLLGQHGDDFKRIAASMPNKTTVQVSNYYKTNLIELKLEEVAAGAPKRSPTPELRESSKDSPQLGTVPDPPSMSSLTHERPSLKPIIQKEVPISTTIRSNLSAVSKHPELASVTASPYAHLTYPNIDGRYASNAIPLASHPTSSYTYADLRYAQSATRPGQAPIAPLPDSTQ